MDRLKYQEMVAKHENEMNAMLKNDADYIKMLREFRDDDGADMKELGQLLAKDCESHF